MGYYRKKFVIFLQLGETIRRSPRSYKSAALPTELLQYGTKQERAPASITLQKARETPLLSRQSGSLCLPLKSL
jgi:hypothetical protein